VQHEGSWTAASKIASYEGVSSSRAESAAHAPATAKYVAASAHRRACVAAATVELCCSAAG